MIGLGNSNLESKFYLVYYGHFSAEEVDNMEITEFEYHINRLIENMKLKSK